MGLIEQLDTRTLAFVSGAGGFLMAVTMAGSYWAGMRSRALVDWALAGLCFMVGYQAGHVLLSHPVPVPAWLSATLANFVVALAHVLILTGTLRYLGRPPRTGLLVGFTLALLAITLAVDPIHSNLRTRVMLMSSLYLGLDATAGVLLWRARSRGLTLYRRIAATVLVSYATFLAMRVVYAAATETFTATFSQDAFQVLVFLVSMVFIFTLTLAFALVMFRGTEVELQRLVHHDPLTGLLNRRSLPVYAATEAARCERYGTPMSLVMIDIDHFKLINDRRGHAAGDEVIRRVASCIGLEIRETDTAFRLGGEEFLVLMPSTDLGAAKQGAERPRAATASARMDGVPVTCSFGVATLERGLERWEDTLRRADRALYRAKEAGRNCVVALSIDEAEANAAGPETQPLPLP